MAQDSKGARQAPTGPGGDAVYGLGLIGAVVWFWGEADGAGDYVVGLLKALVWPAFLVHDAFRALSG